MTEYEKPKEPGRWEVTIDRDAPALTYNWEPGDYVQALPDVPPCGAALLAYAETCGFEITGDRNESR